MTIDLDALIREAREYEESREPVDVEVVLGAKVLTVRLPYLPIEVFDKLASAHSPNLAYRDSLGCWFDLTGVTRNHPDVVLIDGDDTDDLFVLRDKEAVYRWPEVFDALSDGDRKNLQAAVWGVYVFEPQQKLKAHREREASHE